MEPATVATAAKTATTTGQLAYKGWGWFRKWWTGSVAITHPQNRQVVNHEWVEVEGTHTSAKGHFWLFTVRGDDYWPHCPINLLPDKVWKERLSVGPQSGSRTVVLLLVWVSDFVHGLFEDIKQRSRKANHFAPVKMIPARNQFSVVQSVVLNVEIKPNE